MRPACLCARRIYFQQGGHAHEAGKKAGLLYCCCNHPVFYDYGGITYYKNTQVYVNAGEWHNVRIKMSDLSGGAAAMTTGNAGEININWEINSLTEDRVLYFDSFEICD